MYVCMYLCMYVCMYTGVGRGYIGDNGKKNGNYYLGFRMVLELGVGVCVPQSGPCFAGWGNPKP